MNQEFEIIIDHPHSGNEHELLVEFDPACYEEDYYSPGAYMFDLYLIAKCYNQVGKYVRREIKIDADKFYEGYPLKKDELFEAIENKCIEKTLEYWMEYARSA